MTALRRSVAAYLRTSTRRQDLESQREAIKTWAEREGCDVEFFEDGGRTGRRGDREGIEALMVAARAGQFERVAMTELSRIGRSLSFVHRTIEELATLGIKIVLTTKGTTLDYDSLEGRALVGALTLAADVEWMLIKERNERGRETIRRNRIKVGGKRRDVSLPALLALRREGRSVRAIASELKVSPATVTRRLREASAGP